MDKKNIPVQTLRRLPYYLHYLNSVRNTQTNISATAISEAYGLNDVQVRKDLAAVSGSGRPKTGYNVGELIGQINLCLGGGSGVKAVLAGAGNLGRALLSYSGFADYGIEIIAAFDTDASLHGTTAAGKPILPLGDMEAVCRGEGIKLGIITTPVASAQSICDELVSYGVTAVWNFAPTILRAADGVMIENENLASSLAILSRHLQEGGGK